MELKEQLINDLNNSSFLYYPCCSMDFQIIPSCINFFNSVNVVNNFIFIDAKKTGWFAPTEFLEVFFESVSLNIVSRKSYVLEDECNIEIREILNDFEQNDKSSIETFINGIERPKALRFVLKHNNIEFTLYYFCFEAITIIEYINKLNLNPSNLFPNSKGLILKNHRGGLADNKHLSSKLILFSKPHYIINDHNNKFDGYSKPFNFPSYENLWISFQEDYNIQSNEDANNMWIKIK
jgi:hypothetical protein